MGKNRKAQQAVNQTQSLESEDDANAPAEFLTSDDFQVVHKKRHQCKRSPDEGSRSRTNSTKFADAEEIAGCHSGFWGVRSKGEEVFQNGGGDCAPQICENGGAEETDDDISENVFNFELSRLEQKAKLPFSDEKATSSCLLTDTDAECAGADEVSENLTSFECCNPEESAKVQESGNSCVRDLNNISKAVASLCLNNDKTDSCVPVSASSVECGPELTSLCDHSDGNADTDVPDNVLPVKCEAKVKLCLKSNEIDKTNVLDNVLSVKCEAKGKLCLNSNEIDKTNVPDDALPVEWQSQVTSLCLNNDGTADTDANDASLVSKMTSLCLHRDPIADTDDTSPGSEYSKISELRSNTETTKKKKKKKSSDSSQKGGRVLTTSSSSDFSEAPPPSQDESRARDRKRPSKKQLAAIHDALLKAKEEEERRRELEESQRKLAEEMERLNKEKQRLEQERKEKKKIKEKQKRERLRSEGKLLSKSQKQSRARLAATLEAFRQQGVVVPQIGEKRPRGPPMNRKRLDSSQSDSGIQRHKSESLSSQESGKDSLSDLPSSFDSKGSWDINDLRATTESESGHFSCSEESDDDRPSKEAAKIANHAKSNLGESRDEDHLSKEAAKIADAKSNLGEDCARLRSAIICVLGHVDTGKTKLLDFIRKTHVQDGEAGGITQQIGATMIPQDALREKCKMVQDSCPLQVPGLLVIDTPGHESFRNLRSRGTSVCDMAILVVDIMHGLQPQTLESIDLLKKSKIPFVVALNKVDRLYGWKSSPDLDIRSVMDRQNVTTQSEFKKRMREVVLQFANQCLNVAVFNENPDPRSFVSMVPTSAITGDGMGNLLSLTTQLTQSFMRKRLTFSEELQATVLEVKAIPGLGTTIDVILVNGRLREGDTIVLVGQEGPVVTQIRSLLMPRPLRELRVKNPYVEYKVIEGSQGVKLTGKDLDRAIAGMSLFVAKSSNEVERYKSEAATLLSETVSNIRTSERGVYVQASTLGSLEALLDYLSSASIPYFGVKVGPVVKRDVMKASIMLEHDKMFAAILAFDVKVDKDAQELADTLGVKVFSANIIYHLFDMFVQYRDEFERKRDEAKHQAVFPCILKVLTSTKPPVQLPSDKPPVLDVLVEAGCLRQHTPLCVSTKSNLELGHASSIEVGGTYVACAKEGQRARIALEAMDVDLPNFEDEDYLVSRVTRQSIEACKEYYKDELDETDWLLMSELKKMLHLHV